MRPREHERVTGLVGGRGLTARCWRDPSLGGEQAVGMLTKDVFDRVGEHLDGASRAGAGRREQDQPGVRLPSRKALRSERRRGVVAVDR
jgi:hypothetical protein